jgi:hypothetical protein
VSLRCPDDLTPQALEWLTGGLAAGLPGLQMQGLFAARVDMFSEADLITVIMAGDTMAGVLASRWARLDSGPRFLHITSQFVAETHRHGAVFRSCWRAHLKELTDGGEGFPFLSALKTYNPVVYCAMRSFTAAPGSTFYPAVDNPGRVPGQPPASLVSEVARALAPGKPFDPATGVIPAAGSPADLYPRMPASRDEAVNAYFARHLRPGDRILCVLDIPPEDGIADMVLRAFGLGDGNA